VVGTAAADTEDGGVEEEDGVITGADLPPVRCSAGCSRRPTIMETHIIIRIPATITGLPRGTPWVTACNGSNPMIRVAERISATMDIAIRVREWGKRRQDRGF
jgi:hypothetical protein